MAEINDLERPDVLSLSDFCAAMQTTERNMRQHIRNGLPVLQRGQRAGAVPWIISWPLACRWLIANAAGNAAVAGESKDEADRRKAVILADIAEITKQTKALDLALRQGELAVIDDIVKPFDDSIIVLRSRLLAVPHKMAPVLAAESDPRAPS